MKLDLFIEVDGNKVLHKSLVEKVKDVWREEGNRVKDIETLELFYKPTEHICYYVINGKLKGSVPT
ncbi:MAG: DUF6465 family protein [Defluviitaleaceae bacterium]|nr:DUF6465 family protein [Defluviitaleaceae bacterium]